VDAALRFGSRHALHAVHAAFILEALPSILPFDRNSRLFESAGFAGLCVHQLNQELVLGRILLVHAQQVRNEQAGFKPAGACANLHNQRTLGHLVLYLPVALHLRKVRSLLLAQRGCFLARHGRHVRIRVGSQVFGIQSLALQSPVGPISLHDILQIGQLF
jgi:hypothetical protein